MFATIRRYESVDKSRTSELVTKVDEGLLAKLSELPGFGGYSLIDTGNGVISSVAFYETSAQADESTKVAADWVREEKLESALPNPPKITTGEVVVHRTSELVRA
jgi:hypothetical protein